MNEEHAMPARTPDEMANPFPHCEAIRLALAEHAAGAAEELMRDGAAQGLKVKYPFTKAIAFTRGAESIMTALYPHDRIGVAEQSSPAEQ